MFVGERLEHGAVPYRDFDLEYPPGALGALWPPALAPGSYVDAFEATELGFAAVCVVFVAYTATRLEFRPPAVAFAATFAGIAPWLLGPISLVRFDLWPAALVIAALAALVADRPKTALALLGVAAAAKIYALALAPIALLYVARRLGGRAAAVAAAVGAAAAVAVVAPFVAVAPRGARYPLSWHTHRGLHFESSAGSVFALLDAVGARNATLAFRGGAWEVAGRAADVVADAQTVVAGIAVGAVAFVFARGGRSERELVCAAAATLLVLLGTSKVLSPQFLLWLVPVVALVPLVGGVGGAVIATLFVVTLLLTHVLFPGGYAELSRLDPQYVAILVARNVVLLAAAVVAVVSTRAASRAAAARARPS